VAFNGYTYYVVIQSMKNMFETQGTEVPAKYRALINRLKLYERERSERNKVLLRRPRGGGFGGAPPANPSCDPLPPQKGYRAQRASL
jgi:hypothetical protein